MVPLAVNGLVITGLAATTVIVKVAVPLPPAFVAPSVTAEVPAVVGVPEITPSAGSSVSPAGSPVWLKLVGLLLAMIV